MLENTSQASCTRCHLHLGATNVKVKSRGSDDPIILFVGEAPGRTEDARGVCFIGKAGRSFGEYMKAADLDPELCRWTNVVRCIPWNDTMTSFRAPSQSEIDACRYYLEAEILRTDPVFIVPLGNSALHALCPKAPAIGKARKNRYDLELPSLRYRYNKAIKWISYQGFDEGLKRPRVPSDKNMKAYIKSAEDYGFKHIETKIYTVKPTYHPSAAARGNEQAKVSIIEDLSYLRTKVSGDDSIPFDSYDLLVSLDEIKDRFENLKERYKAGAFKYITLDVEIDSDVNEKERRELNPYLSPEISVILYSLSWGKGQALTIPYNHPESPFYEDEIAQKAISSMTQDLLDDIPLVNFNLKFDLHWLNRIGVYPKIIHGDPMLASWTLFNDTIREHSLESLTTQFAGMVSHKEEMRLALEDALAEYGEARMSYVDLDINHRYCCMDADATWRLQEIFDKMMKQEGLYDAHNRICVPAILPTQRMERYGVYLDTEMIKLTKGEYEEKLKGYYDQLAALYEEEILEEANRIKREEAMARGKKPPKPYEEFGFGKTKQRLNLTNFAKRIILFEILGFSPIKHGKTGPSVDKETINTFIEECLEHIGTDRDSDDFYSHRFEVLEIIRDFNGDQHMYSFYIKPIPKFADSNSIVHTNYGIRTTKTGRYNCRKPSLHVMPWHSVSKRAFKPLHPDGLIASVDYSQMELRVLASVTGDEDMLRAFHEGLDIHRTIASIVLNKEPDEILTAERRRIKTVVFGLCYGRGPTSIAAQERISTDDAKALVNKFFKMFPRIAEWVKKQHRYAKKHNCIWSPHGFRRKFGDWLEDDERDRRSVNTPIQGAASDIGLIGLITMDDLLERITSMRSTAFGYVHDSLIYSVWPGELWTLCTLARKGMVEIPSRQLDWLKAPLKVDYEIGPSWGELTEAKVLPDRKIIFEGCKPDYYKRIVKAFKSWDDPPVLLDYKEVEELEDGSELFQSLSATATREARKEVKINAEWQFAPLKLAS